MKKEYSYQLTIWSLFRDTVAQNGNFEALVGKYAAKHRTLTYNEWYNKALHLAAQLHHLGLNAGDRVLIISTNVLEWYILDMALSRLGVVNISLFPNYAPDDYRHILADAQPAALFIGDALLLTLLQPALHQYTAQLLRFSIRPVPGFVDFSTLIGGDAPSEELPQPPGPEAVYSIFYTSGTGGNPKGVLTLNRGISAAAVSMGRALALIPQDRAISFLSVSHAYERGHYLAYVAFGSTLILADPGSSPANNINNSQASVMTAVPLLLQRIVDGLSATLDTEESQQAMAAAFAFEPGDMYHSPSPEFPALYASWKASFGSHLRVLSCAGAPLPERLARFFWAIGIPLQEVYGLTECFSVTYARRQSGIRLGTVGPVAEFAEVRLAQDGEVLFRGPFLMAGFHNLPDLTRQVIDLEGWFYTGDLGEWIDDKYLRLIGRKKDQFKIASGNYVHPGSIEGQLMMSKSIAQAVVFERDGCLEAVLQPAEAFLEAEQLRRGTNDAAILRLLEDEVSRVYNNGVLEPEQIIRLHLAEKEWGILSGELTPSMKVKRQAVIEKILT